MIENNFVSKIASLNVAFSEFSRSKKCEVPTYTDSSGIIHIIILPIMERYGFPSGPNSFRKHMCVFWKFGQGISPGTQRP